MLHKKLPTLSIKDLRADPAIIENIFFDAMSEGFANPETHAKTVSTKEGWRKAEYYMEQWAVVDEWQITPHSDFSIGSTLVRFDHVPVWGMQYWGRYEQNAIPFLKTALVEEYGKRRFTGGRGPVTFTAGDLHYANDVLENGFCEFRGYEMIATSDSTRLGFHRYHGGLMI